MFWLDSIKRTGALILLVASVTWGDDDYNEPRIKERDRQHWSFRPIVRPDVPEATENPVDAFLLRRLKEQTSLSDFAPKADPATLLRRLTCTLTGLPPTTEQRNEFAEIGFDAMVDRLLASPHYGERQAQHWLDLARFAETDGFEHDKVRDEAWRYRDWVVDAFNRDLPYDRFVALQIAADEIAPNDPAEKAATGFLFAGPDMPDINLEAERRHNVLNEITGTVGSVFLGMTMGCAQCHDHKADPISHVDYFRLRAFFENVELPDKNKSLPYFFSERGSEQPPAFLYARGDFRDPGQKLKPAFLTILNPEDERPNPKAMERSTGYRSEFAEWLTSGESSLTARVIANRLWMQDFGKPIVNTPSDFGFLGGLPSHPELLDWLATELIRMDWSMKSLHRMLVTSRAWRQSSRKIAGDAKWEVRNADDPKNQWLSRFPRRRLSGEEIRDGMLVASGLLNRKMGGPGVRPPLPEEVTRTLLKDQWNVTEDEAEHRRRSLYIFARRNLRYPLFDAFDRPDGNASCARRHTSTTAPQSLVLLNSDFSLGMADELATRANAGGEDPVVVAWKLVLNRNPTPVERERSESFLRKKGNHMADICLALFNANEFVWLD